MDNYKDIAAKENKLNEKKILVDDTIQVGKLSKYEIIKKMIDGLVDEIEDLKKILFTDLAVTNNSKEKAEKKLEKTIKLDCCICLENIKKIDMVKGHGCNHHVCWKCYGKALHCGKPIVKCPLCRGEFTNYDIIGNVVEEYYDGVVV